MRKFYCFLFCVTILLSSGCHQPKAIASNGQSDVASGNTDLSSETNKNPYSSATITEGTPLNIPLDKPSLVALFNNQLILYKDTDSKLTEAAKDETIIDSFPLKADSVTQICKLYSVNTYSNDLVVMKNKNLYFCPLLVDKEYNNALIDIDFEKKTAVYEKRYNLNSSPLVYFDKINDSEFLISYWSLLTPEETENGSDDTYETHISKYNVDTKLETPVLCERFDRNTQRGVLISSFSLEDDQLYAYAMTGNGSGVERTINVYDLNGTLQKSIPLPGIEDALKSSDWDDSVFRIAKLGDYFFFETINASYLLYKYTDSGVEQQNLNVKGQVRLIYPFNISNRSENPYAYFREFTNNAIGIFNKRTGEYKSLQLNIGGYQYIYDFVVDESGNIVVNLSKDKNKTERRFYYIESEKLLAAH